MRPGEPAKLSRFHPESFEKYWLSVSVDPSLTIAEYQLGIVRSPPGPSPVFKFLDWFKLKYLPIR